MLRVGELGVLPLEFARDLSALAGFRNVLVLGYTTVCWDDLYRHLQSPGNLIRFLQLVTRWLT